VVGAALASAHRLTTGATRSTIPLPGEPCGLVVAPATDRTFVLSAEVTPTGTHGCPGDQLSVLDIAAGTLLRTLQLPSPGTLLKDASGSLVYVVDVNHVTWMLDPSTGRPRWALALPGLAGPVPPRYLAEKAPLGAQIAADPRTGHVFAAEAEGPVMHDALTGARLTVMGPMFSQAGQGPGALSLAVDPGAGRAFVAGSEGVLIVDARTGQMLAVQSLPIPPVTLLADGQRHRLFAVGSLGVSVLDARSGRLLRTRRLAPDLRLPPTVLPDGRLLFVASGSGRLCLLAASGALTCASPTGWWPWVVREDAAIGRLFALSQPLPPGASSGGGSRVEVRDAAQGTVLHGVSEASNPVALAVDEQGGRVLIANEDGGLDPLMSPSPTFSIMVLDATSGRERGRVQVEGVAQELGIDPRARRAVVLSAWANLAGEAPTWMPPWLRRWLPFGPAVGADHVPGLVTLLDLSRLGGGEDCPPPDRTPLRCLTLHDSSRLGGSR
jgi:DNA-binding beta-propeller fold protein YncE